MYNAPDATFPPIYSAGINILKHHMKIHHIHISPKQNIISWSNDTPVVRPKKKKVCLPFWPENWEGRLVDYFILFFLSGC